MRCIQLDLFYWRSGCKPIEAVWSDLNIPKGEPLPAIDGPAFEISSTGHTVDLAAKWRERVSKVLRHEEVVQAQREFLANMHLVRNYSSANGHKIPKLKSVQSKERQPKPKVYGDLDPQNPLYAGSESI